MICNTLEHEGMNKDFFGIWKAHATESSDMAMSIVISIELRIIALFYALTFRELIILKTNLEFSAKTKCFRGLNSEPSGRQFTKRLRIEQTCHSVLRKCCMKPWLRSFSLENRGFWNQCTWDQFISFGTFCDCVSPVPSRLQVKIPHSWQIARSRESSLLLGSVVRPSKFNLTLLVKKINLTIVISRNSAARATMSTEPHCQLNHIEKHVEDMSNGDVCTLL